MAFLQTVAVSQAQGEVRRMYQQAQGSLGFVPNYAQLFSLRPEVYTAWGQLIGSIRGHLDARRYELVTLAAAQALGSSYCSLAHGQILHEWLSPGQLSALLRDPASADLTPLERAIMDFAGRVARDAASITEAEIDRLREHGLSDGEIFDVAAAASARCFFSTLLDALGAQPDAAYGHALGEALCQQLAVGRLPSQKAVERL